MIGNDIVDLFETKRSSNWRRTGFLQKVFTPKERSIINASKYPAIAVWRIWSMKESAYKAFIQSGGSRFFNPKKIECRIESQKKGGVKINEMYLKSNTFINSKYIFTTSTFDNPVIENKIFRLAENNYRHQSDFMHQKLLEDFAKKNSIALVELKIQKTKKGVPMIYCKDKVFNTSLSITHHGFFGAYSILKTV